MKKCLLGTIAGAAVVACSSFGGDTPTTPPDDAGTPIDSGSAIDSGTPPTDGASPISFCAQYPATVLLCDDFENESTYRSIWQATTVGGGFSLQDEEGHGQVLRAAAKDEKPNVQLFFSFDKQYLKNGVTFDVDFRVENGDYEYISLALLSATQTGPPSIVGLAKGSGVFGQYDSPPAAGKIQFDTKWHHLHLELLPLVQTSTLDGMLINQLDTDITSFASGSLTIGILAATSIGTDLKIANVLYDNALLVAK